MAPPNILLILTDQQRTDSLGCYGGRHVPTPHLDALAAGGTVFERCYVNSPICTPSRACLWTGKTVFGHGVQALHDVLPAGEALFPVHLQAAGYTTALFGKLHVSARLVDANERHPQAGFDVYESALSPYNHDCRYHAYRDWLRERDPRFLRRLAEEGSDIGPIPEAVHYSTWVTERVENFVGQQTGARPFFCCASFVDPHDPYDDHPPGWPERVALGDLTRVERPGGDGDRPAGVRREEAEGALGSVDEYTDEEIVHMRRSYYASVGFLDACIGRILGALQRRGVRERTLILFASDHGDMLGQRRLLGKGAHFYEPCARVPLLLWEPGGRRGAARSPALVQPHDLAATALHAAGYSADWIRARMPAAIPLQRGTGHECVFGVYRNSGINRQKTFWDPPIHCTMVRDARYKLTAYHDAPPAVAGPGELYDLARDPGETRNLWAKPAGAAPRAALLARLESWLAQEEKAGAGGRGGRVFPPPEHWLRNNPIHRAR